MIAPNDLYSSPAPPFTTFQAFLIYFPKCRTFSTTSTVFRKKFCNTDMRRLTTGIRSEKCVVRRFRRCANVIECTYINLDSIAYLHTYAIRNSLLLLGYKPVHMLLY